VQIYSTGPALSNPVDSDIAPKFPKIPTSSAATSQITSLIPPQRANLLPCSVSNMKSDSESTSSSHETSSCGDATTTNTSQPTSPGISPTHPKLDFKEFIPRNAVSGVPTCTYPSATVCKRSFSLTAANDNQHVDDAQCTSLSSNASDLAITTGKFDPSVASTSAFKDTDILLAMK